MDPGGGAAPRRQRGCAAPEQAAGGAAEGTSAAVAGSVPALMTAAAGRLSVASCLTCYNANAKLETAKHFCAPHCEPPASCATQCFCPACLCDSVPLPLPPPPLPLPPPPLPLALLLLLLLLLLLTGASSSAMHVPSSACAAVQPGYSQPAALPPRSCRLRQARHGEPLACLLLPGCVASCHRAALRRCSAG